MMAVLIELSERRSALPQQKSSDKINHEGALAALPHIDLTTTIETIKVLRMIDDQVLLDNFNRVTKSEQKAHAQ